MKKGNNIELNWNINFGTNEEDYLIEEDLFYSAFEEEYIKSNREERKKEASITESLYGTYISSENVNDWISVSKVKGGNNQYEVLSEVNGYLKHEIFSKKKLSNYILDYIDYSSEPKEFLKKYSNEQKFKKIMDYLRYIFKKERWLRNE